MTNPIKKTHIFIFTIILAFCSMTYELLLAQLMSAILGNTILRYAITIGLFVFSLGIGSFIFEQLKNKTLQALITVEILLCVIAIVSPYFLLILRKLLIEHHQAFLYIAHLPILSIGILSGIELPLLMNLESGDEKQLQVLSVDYFGMFLGSLLFPLVLFPSLGLFSTLLFVCSLNFAVALLLCFHEYKKSKPLLLASLATGFCLALAGTFLPEWTQQIASQIYRTQ